MKVARPRHDLVIQDLYHVIAGVEKAAGGPAFSLPATT